MDSHVDDPAASENEALPPEGVEAKEARAGWRRWSPRARVALVAVAVLTLGILTCGVYEVVTWPDVGSLREVNPETTAFIERYKERLREAGRSPEIRQHWVPLDQISPNLKRAVIVGEDIEFFSHEGFAVSEIKEAIRDALSGTRLRGASTITQQLAKNLWLSPSKNPLRKLREALLTRQLENHLSKRRILELYLNVVEFGPGIYGAEAAARHYFGKPAAQLSEWESAQLAASLPRPSRWHPGVESDAYWWYVSEVQGRMDEATFLWRYFTPLGLPEEPEPVPIVPVDTVGPAEYQLPPQPGEPMEAVAEGDSLSADTTAVPPDTAVGATARSSGRFRVPRRSGSPRRAASSTGKLRASDPAAGSR